jgi:hypothetical protein
MILSVAGVDEPPGLGELPGRNALGARLRLDPSHPIFNPAALLVRSALCHCAVRQLFQDRLHRVELLPQLKSRFLHRPQQVVDVDGRVRVIVVRSPQADVLDHARASPYSLDLLHPPLVLGDLDRQGPVDGDQIAGYVEPRQVNLQPIAELQIGKVNPHRLFTSPKGANPLLEKRGKSQLMMPQ